MSRPKKILFICASPEEVTTLRAIADALPEMRAVFSPAYGGRKVELLRSLGLLERTPFGYAAGRAVLSKIGDLGLPCEPRGLLGDFAMVVQGLGRISGDNLAGRALVLVEHRGATALPPPRSLADRIQVCAASPSSVARLVQLGWSRSNIELTGAIDAPAEAAYHAASAIARVVQRVLGAASRTESRAHLEETGDSTEA